MLCHIETVNNSAFQMKTQSAAKLLLQYYDLVIAGCAMNQGGKKTSCGMTRVNVTTVHASNVHRLTARIYIKNPCMHGSKRRIHNVQSHIWHIFNFYHS